MHVVEGPRDVASCTKRRESSAKPGPCAAAVAAATTVTTITLTTARRDYVFTL